MFTVKKEVTLILDNNITLRGHNGNTSSLVYVNDGLFEMNNGSTITGNISNSHGGGVYVYGGRFTMKGGTIIGNTAMFGGGLYVDGGGIHVTSKGTFNLLNGIISNNNAKRGGGLYMKRGNVYIKGGTIASNIAREYGGGFMYEEILSEFAKNNGIITGYKSDQTNGNVVKDEDGTILSRKGHAIYVGENKRKETTAGPSDNFVFERGSVSGAWDQ